MSIRQLTLNRVTTLLRDTILCKIMAGAGYGVRAYIYQGSSFADMEFNSPQCLLLALLHSLVMEDIMSCCLLADVCHNLQQLRSDYLGVWLATDFAFPCQEIEKAMTFLSKLLDAGTLKLPDHVTRIMSSLATKYRIQPRSPSTVGHGDLAISLEEAVVHDSPGDVIACEVSDVNSLNSSAAATTLEEAVRNNDVSSVKALLSAGANTEKLFIRGNTYLHIAAGGGHNEVLSALLEEGMDVNRKNYAEETPLFVALRARNVRGVELLLDKSADAEIVPGYSKNLLEIAAESQDIEMLKVLMRFCPHLKTKDGDAFCHLVARSGCTEMLNVFKELNQPGNEINFDGSARNVKGETALYLASARGELELVRTLCEGGAAVDSQDDAGTSPLMIAVKNNKDDVASFLFNNGANPNIKDNVGRTALHYAAEGDRLGIVSTQLEEDGARGEFELVRTLCEGGAAVDAQDKAGTSPLMIAIKNTKDDVALFLLNNGANPNIKDNVGRTALHYAAEGDRLGIVSTQLEEDGARGEFELVRTLCEGGAAVDSQDDAGTSPLMIAVKNNKDDIASFLLNNGANPNIKDNVGRTALHYAAEGGRFGIVSTLLEAGARVKDCDNEGDTPVFLAALNNKPAVTRLLVENWGDLALRDSIGDGILHGVARSGNVEIVAALIDAGAEVDARSSYQWTALHQAAEGGHTAVVAALIDAGAEVDARGSDQYTALHRAAEKGHTAVLAALIDAGAEVEARGSNQYTALHYAAREGHTAVVAALIDAGAEVDARGSYQWTALHRAAEKGHTAVVAALIDAGAEVDARGNDQYTALHYAAEGGHTAVMAALLDRGADLAARTSYGSTPLMLASRFGHLGAVQLLVGRGPELNAKDNGGWTALRWASGNSAVADYLRSRGGAW